MKRILLCLILCLSLVLSSAFADAYPADSTPIMVDGLRIGFFDAAGMYLPPISVNGVTYVPVLSFADNLKLDAEVNGQAVKVNGMTIAMFGEDGAYLPPVDVNGVAYVPALAFAQSAGLETQKTEKGIAVTLKAAVEQEPTAAPAPVHPEYVEIALTSDNFRKYFSYDFSIQNFYNYERELSLNDRVRYKGNLQSFQGNCVFSCTARTAYQFKNVSFTPSANVEAAYYNGINISAPKFRSITMPQAGYTTEKAEFSSSYFAYVSYIDSPSDLQVKNGKLVNITGTIMLPWEEGCAVLYSDANSYHSSGQYDKAISIWKKLSDGGYKDAAERLEQSTAAKNKKQEDAYQTGLEYLNAGNFEAAIEALRGLDYKDSKELLKQAQNGKSQAAYDAAAALEAEGKYLEAKAAFEAIRSFADAASRAQACGEAYKNLYEPGYQSALSLMQEKKYDEAVAVFQTLNGYEDSAKKIEECQFNKVYDEAKALEEAQRFEEAIVLYEQLNQTNDVTRCQEAIPARDYAAAKALYDKGAYDEAEAAFKALGEYKDAAKMAAQCPVEKIYVQAMAFYHSEDYVNAYPLLAQIYNDARVKPLLKLDPQMPAAQLGALLQKDNIVWFGPAAWFVIDHGNGKNMLFTVESIGQQVFRTEQSKPSWQNSDIRKWLNGTYYKKFTEEEKKLILSTQVKNPKYTQAKNTVPAGGTTEDKLFLLNWQEAEQLSLQVLDSVSESWWLRTNTNHNSYDQSRPWWHILVCGGSRNGQASISVYDYCHGKRATRAAMWVKAGYKSLESGNSGEAVLDLETKLQKGGFFTDNPDKSYNSKTVTAVKAAQEALGLKKTGIADYAFRYQLDAYLGQNAESK